MCRSKPKREKVSDAASALRTRAANVRWRKCDTAKEEKDIVHAWQAETTPNRAYIFDPFPIKHHSSGRGSRVKSSAQRTFPPNNLKNYNSSIVSKTTALVATYHSALFFTKINKP